MNFAGFLALAWGRLRSKLGLSAAICASTMMIIALTVGIPQFANAVGKLTVQDELARSAQLSASPAFAVRCYSSMGTGRALTVSEAEYAWRWLGQLLEREVGLPVVSGYGRSESFSFNLQGRPDDPRYKGQLLAIVRTATLFGAEKHIRAVEGLPIGEGVPEVPDGTLLVWLERSFAEGLMLRPGETYHLATIGEEPLVARIAGIWEATDPTERFWPEDPRKGFQGFLIVTPEQYDQYIAPLSSAPTTTNIWYYILDDRRVDLRRADRYIAGLERVRLELGRRLPSGTMDISPLEELDRGRQRSVTLLAILFGFSMPLLVLLVYFTGALSAMAARFQNQELATLASRGMSRSQILALILIECGLILCVAVPGGLALGLLLARTMGQTRAFLVFGLAKDLPVSLLSVDWLFVAAASLLSVMARALPSWFAGQLTIVTYEQRRSRPEVWSAARKVFLLPLLVFTLLAYQRLRALAPQGGMIWYPGSDPRNDLLRVLAPALLMLTLALFGAEALGLLMAPLARLAALLRSPVTYLGCMSLSRGSGRYRTPSFMLILALCTGVFYASLAKSADTWMMSRLQYAVGADLTFQQLTTAELRRMEGGGGPMVGIRLEPSWTVPISQYRQLPGVEEAARVGDYPATVSVPGFGGTVRFLAVDRLDLPKVIYFRADYAQRPLGELLNALALNPNGLLVPNEMLRALQLQVGDDLPVSVVLDEGQFSATFKIVGSFDYFPTMYSDQRYVLVGNLSFLETETSGQFPFGIWMKLAPDADVEAILREVDRMNVPVKEVRDLSRMLRADLESLERVGIFGGLSIYFLGGALLATIGQIVYTLFALTSQSVSFAVYRALGMHRSEVARLAAVQFFLSLLYGLGVGIILGAWVARTFVPFLPLTTTAQPPVPAFVPLLDWASAWRIAVILGLAQVAMAALSAVQVARSRVFEQLRLGEKH